MPDVHNEFIGENERRGRFANNVSSWFTQTEFVLEFGIITPEGSGKDSFNALIQSRSIMTPQMFKILVKHVSDALANYEKQFGEIKVSPQTAAPIPPKKETHYR